MIKPNKCIDCRVLIIKGNADRLNYRHLLSFENCQFYYQIQQCKSISEIYGEEPPDCILLDWELCDRLAEEFLQQLSQDSVPIVILAEARNQALFTHFPQDVLIKETLTQEFLDFAVHQAIAKAQLKKQLTELEAKLYRSEQRSISITGQNIRSTNQILKTIHNHLSNQFLRESYERRQGEINLQTFLNNAPAIIFTKDLAGRYLSVNKEFELKLQISFAQIGGKTDYDFLRPETAKALCQNDQQAISEKRAIHVEETVELEDGLHTYIATKFPLLDEQGEPFGMAGISIDISDRIAIENSLKVQNTILEKIAKGHGISDILDLLLITIENQLGQAFCSIMTCDRQGRLFCLSAPNLPETYISFCDGVPIAEGVGSCGTAAFRKQTVIVTDIATDPLWHNFKEVPLNHGLKACWSVPIVSSDGSILGTFGVYHQKICAPQTQELEIVTKAAYIAGIAIEKEFTAQSLLQLNATLEHRVEQRTIALQASESFLEMQNRCLSCLAIGDPLPQTLDLVLKLIDLEVYFEFYSILIVNESDKLIPIADLPDDFAVAFDGISLTEAEIIFGRDSLNLIDIDTNIHWQRFHSLCRSQGSKTCWSIPLFGQMGIGQKQLGVINLFFSVSRQPLEREIKTIKFAAYVASIAIERNHNELALQESYQFIQQIADASPNILYLYDLQQRQNIYANNGVFNILGYSGEQVYKMGANLFPTLIYKDDLAKVDSHFEQLSHVEDGEVLEIEYRAVNSNGDIKYLLSRNTAFNRDSSGKVKQIIGTAQDISDRKKAEIELAKSQNELLAVFNAIQDLIIILNAEGRYLEVSPSSAHLLYKPAHELIGRTLHKVLPKESADLFLQTIEQTISSQSLKRLEYTLTKNDRLIWFEASIAPLYEDQVVWVARDISDRKKVELENQALKERLEFVLSSSPSIIYAFKVDDKKAVTTFISENIKSILGYTSEEFLSVPDFWEQHIYPADAPQVFSQIPNLFENCKNTVEYRFLHQDGTYRWLQDQAQLIRDREGIPIEFVGSLTDISDRKAMEFALQTSEAKNRVILEAIPDLLLKLNRDGSCVDYIKPSIGADKFLTIENHISEVLPPKLLQNQLQIIEQAIATGELQIYEHEFLKRDQKVYEEIRILAINDNEVLVIVRDISDRKLVEIALKTSENRFLEISESSPSIIYIFVRRIDGSFYFEHSSRAVESIHEISVEQVLEDAKTIHDCIHPDDRGGYEEAVQISMATLQAFHYEWRIITPSGNIKWLQGNSSPMLRDNGEIAWYGVVSDISDRKFTEEALNKSELKLRKLAENTPGALYQFLLRKDGTQSFPFMSQGSNEIYGIDPEVVENNVNSIFNLVHPEDMQSLHDSIALSARTLNRWQWEGRSYTALGEIKWLSGISQPELLANGDVLWHGMVRDISDRKKVELELLNSQEKLRQSEELLRLTIENTPVGISTFDLEGNFLSANQDMCRIFGYSRDELTQKNMLLLTHPNSTKLTLAGVYQLIAGTERKIHLEKQYIHKNGRIIDAISRISLVKDTEENPLHFVASVEDITEQKRIAIALKQRMDRQEFLMNITQQIRQSLNLEQVLETAVNEVKRLLNSDRTVIFQLFADGETKVVKEAVEPNYPAILNRNYCLDENFTNQVFEYYINSNIRIVADVLQDEWASCLLEFMQEAQVKSKIVVPIVHHINPRDQEKLQTYRWRKGNSQLWGLLIVHSCEKIRHWQPEEVELLQQLANQLAIAIQQANLYKQVQDELLENKRLNSIVNNELVQKKVLLREIHHRVKNNLQVMSSILYLQFRHTPPEIKLLSQEYQNRIYSMALIHDQLHRGDNVSQIDFDIYITSLATNLFQCYATNPELIQLEVNASDIFLTLDISIPLGLIINELISNALKYAFPASYGKIRIQLLSTAESIILTVSDNGVGIPDSFDLKNARSTGMQLIQSLTEQLEGEFTYHGENGSTFQITVPRVHLRFAMSNYAHDALEKSSR